jgi:hypothetical protein
MSISIKLDKDLVSYLGQNKIKIDELFVIVCFTQGKLDILKAYLKDRNPDQCAAYLQPLERKLLMRKISQDVTFDWDNYELTDGAFAIYKDLMPYVDQIAAPVIVEESTSKMDELVDSFLNLFPGDIKNAGGEKLRSNRLDTMKKMTQFMNKYKVKNPELILSSTERYLNRMKSANGYQFCSSAMYFILKDGVSKLATECENVVEENPDIWQQLA